MQIVAIDQGTTSTRLLQMTPAGVEIGYAVAHRQIYPRPGWVEHDPEELLTNIRACLAHAGDAGAVGLANQGESCLAWDAKTLRPLSPVIVWQDNRTAGEIDLLAAQGVAPEVRARAGLPLDPYFSAAKLGWLLRNLPEAAQAHRAGRLCLGTTDAFFLHRLTGRFVTDVTTASRTSLMNLASLQWDEELCRIFGVPMDTLPRIVPTTGRFGTLQLPDDRQADLMASVVDQQAALFGFGCRKPGDAKITFGTGAFALMVTGESPVDPMSSGLLPTVAWQFEGRPATYAVDGGVYTASAALNWARDLGLIGGWDELDRLGPETCIERGLAFVPALAGLGAPHWQAGARGAWLGLGLGDSRTDLAQALLEGVAFRAAEVIDAMRACHRVAAPVLVDGGMSRNRYFTGFLADLLDLPLAVAEVPELTGIGAINLVAETLDAPPARLPEFRHVAAGADRSDQRARFSRAIALVRDWARPGYGG